MPTTNPRINVTLSPSLDLLVSRLARHQRVSKSQVLRELLEAAEPALQRAAALMDAAKEASKEARAGLARHMNHGIATAEDSMAVIMNRLAVAQADLVSEAESVRGRRPRRMPRSGASAAAGAGGDPPASNRGVKSPGKAGKRAAKKGSRVVGGRR